jgi:dTDP-4-amino-4,6-dideoxygalactose transaminase
MAISIPFNKPCLTGNELAYVAESIRQGHISGDGDFTRRAQGVLVSELGVQRALLTTSCTHALELIALLLEIRPGDEVILPSFTFVSTANAFVLRGAKPVFVDIRADTLNIDESRIEAAITSRTRAVVVVHYAGVGCEMDSILASARGPAIPVIEDNAHGLFARYNGKALGTFGPLAAQSFHETKNIICGEGGALLISDPAYIERAEYIREKGTNRNRFFRGQVDKYSWVDVGSSYVLSDMLAGFLLAQLESRDDIQQRRRRIWERYADRLAGWAGEHDVRLPVVPKKCVQAYHMFYLLLPSLNDRQALIAHLQERGVMAVFHYLPLHLSKMGRMFGGCPGQCPVTESISDRLLRLPFYTDLSEADQETVISAVTSFHASRCAGSSRALG